MNKPGSYRIVSSILIVLLFSAAAFAKVSEKTYQLVQKNLSTQLKQDLTENSLTVKFKDIREINVSSDTVNLVGDAYCILDKENTKLPIHFEAVVNTSKDEIAYIDYKFVEETEIDYTMTREELVTQAVMEKIHKDFDTTNIVFSVEGLERMGNSNKFQGFGEIKIEDLAIRKIKFDVEFDEINSQVKIGSYQIAKP